MNNDFTARARTEILESLGGAARAAIAAAAATQWFDLIVRVNDANFPVPSVGDTFVSLRGLTVDRTVTLPATPPVGQVVCVKCEDGSLDTANIIISGNGNTIDGAANYTMTLAQDGAFGTVLLLFQGAGWSIF